ncbi:MAG: hypothetical protein Ta2E_11380 [Mycoplasmoidaceae bacterium]|nr:MAG: hypothetical protein Ta2E_11380 [Mycoplasmoidaceae bacterium]
MKSVYNNYCSDHLPKKEEVNRDYYWQIEDQMFAAKREIDFDLIILTFIYFSH